MKQKHWIQSQCHNKSPTVRPEVPDWNHDETKTEHMIAESDLQEFLSHQQFSSAKFYERSCGAHLDPCQLDRKGFFYHALELRVTTLSSHESR